MRLAVAFLFAATVCSAQKPDPEAIFNQALAAQQQGDLQTAVAGYENVLKLVPNLVPARVNLAAALMQLGRNDEALENFRAAIKVAPADPQVALLFGNALFQTSRYSEAMQVLNPVEKAHPDNLDVSFLLGETLIHLQKPREGLTLVLRVAKARNDADAYVLAGLTQMQLTDFADAKSSSGEAVRLQPTNAAAWTLHGMASAASGDLSGAEAAYRKALELNSNDFEANLRLGTLLLRMDHDVESAKPYLDRALQIDPSSLSARFEVANAQVALGDDSAAIDNFEKVIAGKPDATEAHVQLSSLYSKAKRKQDARREREIVDRLMETERASATRTKNPEDELAVFSSTTPSH